jgi:hypothetical protein
VDCPHDYSIQEINDAEGNIVAVAVREKHDEDSTETAVNATLLAAAPELLAALQEVKAWLSAIGDTTPEDIEDFVSNSWEDVEGRVDEAIAKATINH